MWSFLFPFGTSHEGQERNKMLDPIFARPAWTDKLLNKLQMTRLVAFY